MQKYRISGSGGAFFTCFKMGFLLLLLMIVGAVPVQAEQMRLAITGKITSEHGAIYYSPGDLSASTPTEIVTSSPWTVGKTRFRGVLLRDILKGVDARGTKLRATAIDGYSVEIPISDTEKYDVIIAYKMDGEWLENEVYAPFWIIYPYDSDKKLAQEKYYSRSIWQLTKLTVE
ncbi:MAG: oxidoreductase [Alphaproteobacteria bacterium]|nr:MAG: oxidoreductase [Alphaproteobacteria bacterium]